MGRHKLRVYLHIVWATWNRLPLITPDIERRVYRVIENEAMKLGCTVIALNGMPDHVHLLVKFPATLSIAVLMRQVKGVSSYFINHVLRPGGNFKWQRHYGVFAVSPWNLAKIIHYVKNQKEHHLGNSLELAGEQHSES